MELDYSFEEVATRAQKCLSLLYCRDLINDNNSRMIPEYNKIIFNDRRNKYKLSMAILGVARRTRNKIIDKNILLVIAKMIWDSKRTVEVDFYLKKRYL
jgi:hypothetical protein